MAEYSRTQRLRWFPLVRHEASRLLLSKGPWLLAVVLPLWIYRPSFDLGDAFGANVTITFVQYVAHIVVPFAVVLLCYRTIAGERESKQLKSLLNLPLSRQELFIAKFLGRLIGVLTPILLAIAIVTGLGVVNTGLMSIPKYLAVLGVTVVYVAALVGITVSVSAVVRRGITAAAVLFFGVVVVMELLWRQVVGQIVAFTTDAGLLTDESTRDSVVIFLQRLTPSESYYTTTNWVLSSENAVGRIRSSGEPAIILSERFNDIPWYLHEGFGPIILLLWVVLPLGIGMFVFSRGDAL